MIYSWFLGIRCSHEPVIAITAQGEMFQDTREHKFLAGSFIMPNRLPKSYVVPALGLLMASVPQGDLDVHRVLRERSARRSWVRTLHRDDVRRMGTIPNCFSLLVGAGVLVAWSQANNATWRSHTRPVRLLAALGILAFIFSIVSPDDDLLPQTAGVASPQYARMGRTLRPVPRACTTRLAVAVLRAKAHLLLYSRTDSIQIRRKRSDVKTVPFTPACIHSPPV